MEFEFIRYKTVTLNHMTESLIEFHWWVSGAGYKWVSATTMGQESPPRPLPDNATEDETRSHRRAEFRSRPRLFLTDGIPLGSRDESRRVFCPLKDFRGVLYRRFAQTPLDPDGIKKFADAFGLLGGDIGDMIPVERIDATRDFMGAGEDLNDWLFEITRMAEAVELWDLVRERDTKRLSELVFWDEDSVMLKWSDRRFLLIAASTHHKELFEEMRPGDLVEPVLLAVQKIVDEQLWKKGRAGPRLLWDVDKRTLSQRVMPNGLIGAIWLDFLLAIDGNTDYRPCLNCKAPFPVTPKDQRRKFCSDRCRVAHHRKKRNQGGSP